MSCHEPKTHAIPTSVSKTCYLLIKPNHIPPYPMTTLSLPPSVTATHEAACLSDRYSFISSREIVDEFASNDWHLVHASEAKCRIPDRRGFQKHLLRFTHASQLHLSNSERVETIVFNSHDGASSLQIGAGVFRFVCANGLVVADSTVATIRLSHVNLTMDRVLEASHSILGSASQVRDTITEWKQTSISADDAMHLAEQGIKLRWGNDLPADQYPVAPTTLLQRQRADDLPKDLWTTFNVVQENLIRGGVSDTLRRVNPNSSRQRFFGRVRNLKALDESLRVNRGLWEAASTIHSLNF